MGELPDVIWAKFNGKNGLGIRQDKHKMLHDLGVCLDDLPCASIYRNDVLKPAVILNQISSLVKIVLYQFC